MNRLLSALAGALLLVAPAQGAGIVEYGLSVDSPTLGRPIPYAVYKPFPFPAEGERWPVVYLLHGTSGKDGDWFTWGNLGPILDQALADGRIPPMVVVAPGFGDSWYVDNPDAGGFGLVETALASDLVPAIDASLPTAACRTGRAIGGVSMGGSGAMLQVLDHPDLYVAGISFSGALHQPLVTGDPRRGWISDLYRNIFGNPFDPKRFNAGSPFARINEIRPLKEKPAFYLTIGDSDFPDLIEAAALFHNRLKQIGADTTLRVGPGRHYWDTWQQSIVPALEWLAPKLDTRCK